MASGVHILFIIIAKSSARYFKIHTKLRASSLCGVEYKLRHVVRYFVHSFIRRLTGTEVEGDRWIDSAADKAHHSGLVEWWWASSGPISSLTFVSHFFHRRYHKVFDAGSSTVSDWITWPNQINVRYLTVANIRFTQPYEQRDRSS